MTVPAHPPWPLVGVCCASFSRWGGVSRSPFDTLNVSFGVEDDPEAVWENRRRIKVALGADALVTARQVHQKRLAVIGEAMEEGELSGFDALLTNRPGIALVIQHADCQAVALYDPVRKAVANVHCGWRGSAAGILSVVVCEMGEIYGSHPADLRAVVSPSLGPCCAEFQGWRTLLPTNFRRFQVRPDFFDFRAVTRWQLEMAGLRSNHIEVSDVCTVCSLDHFSYRREGHTGRCATAVMLT